MFLKYFGFVVLLSGYGLRCVDCLPTLTPTNGNPVYVADGTASYDLSWNYNTDGATIKEVELLYRQGNDDIYVAQKIESPNPQALVINPASGYSNRITFSIGSGSVGRVTFRISSIVQSDSRTFKCQISFTTFNPVPVQKSTDLVVVVAPSITLETQSPVTIDKGNALTLLCVASGNPTPSITWTKGSADVTQASNTNYTIASATKDDAGTYTCTARVTVPGVFLSPDSYSVSVTVRYRPQVTSLTSNETVDSGVDVSFTCLAEAVPASIQYSWFKDDGNQKLASNSDFFVNGRFLTVKQVKKSSAGRYSCSGKNDVGEGERRSTFLIVKYAPQIVTVTVSLVDVPLSGSTTLTCQADGYPDPEFSWKFNGKVLNGAQQNTLLLTNIEVKDAGNYTCIATNSRGSQETTRVVNVEYVPDVTNFTTGTPGNAVVQGTKVTLTCSANGYPAPTYTITRGGAPVSQNSPGKIVINNVSLNDEDTSYSCVPTNKVGTGPSKDLTIVVQVPPFNPANTLPSDKQTKDENQNVSYSCTAQAKPAAEFQWVLNGQNLTNMPPYNITTEISGPSNKLFTTFGYLKIKQLTWQQYGNFSCIAFNAAGNVRQNTELEVRYRPVVQTVADHPQNLTLAEGETATFNCKTIGNPPTTGHKWQFNGTDIPGEACSSCTSAQTLTIRSVTKQDAGWYSCIGTNTMGNGPPARAELKIKRKPKITDLPQSGVYTVNETNNVTMVCRADGVPQPTISWTNASSGKNVGSGEQFHIVNTRSSDDGTYTCTATNELGSVSEGLTLHVQTRPTILTSTPMTTNIPGATDEEVELTCIVSGKPTPTLSWKRDPKGYELSSQNDLTVKSITSQAKSIKMRVIVTKAGRENGDKYYCFAVNLLGNDTQEYIIRERGAPDPPVDVKLVPFQVPKAQTVSVNVSWTPGYNGGFDQEFSIHYRKKGSSGDFTEESIGHPANDMHTVHNLSPNTEYEFTMQASNQRGKSESSAEVQVTTPDSAYPPDRGTVKATRMSDDLTEIVVTWTVTDEQVTKLSLEMQEGDGGWYSVPGATNMDTSKTEFKVENLKADKTYRFRLDMRRPGENSPSYVESNIVLAGPGMKEGGDDKPLQNWMIALIAGVAGLLLLAIVVLCLCCFKRRKKSHGADRVNMSQTSSYVVGGPDVNRSLDTRPRSYGMESVEDDPFIEAHFASMQSMNSTDGKKKKGGVGVNYGYLSQDSVQPQPEMLLERGSHLSRNRPMAQSTGELDTNSAYPARGPQRDFNTLPPYHEPPSFEEAMRQSGRKPKTRKSTGDLAGPGQARHSGRRPRQMQSDEPTDSSDGEVRYTPQRAAPPPPRVRHVEPNEEPGYAAVDQSGRVLGPRVLPQGPPTTSAPRNGPMDPTVPYAVPQKKKSRKPRNEPSEPAIGPPPQYTPEDRSPEEPMHYTGDLDLDDPANLPPSERPPDLPPPMAMLPSNRRVPSYHDDPHDGLPEPPSFLRDVVYSQDDRDAVPYRPPPPSSNRQRQPYLNIHGQLVRPSSRESVELRRPDSLRSSRDALTPEPEMPPRQWQPRGSESDDKAAPEINYVSYLV